MEFFNAEDVRIKDGVLKSDAIVDEDKPMIGFNSMDSLSAISPPNLTVAPNVEVLPNTGDNWQTSGQNSWVEWTERSNRAPNPRQRNSNQLHCYNCKEFGHSSRECPQPRRDYSGRGSNRGRRYGTDGDRNRDPVWTYDDNRSAKKFMNQMSGSDGLKAEISKPNLFPQLKNYYLNESLSDISIDIDGQTLFGHKFVLSAKSDVFKELLFSKDMTGSDSDSETDKEKTEKKEKNVLRLVDTNFEAFKLMLKFLYFEELHLKDEKVSDYRMAVEVLKLSKRFRIERLSTLMEKELMESLEIDNFVDICKHCLDSDSKQLNESLKQFIRKNERNIIEKKLFINESIEVMTKILESMEIQKSIIDALTLILESNPELEVSALKQLIDFKDCSIEDIDVLKKIGLFDEKELFGIVRQKYQELWNQKKPNYN